MKEDKYTKSLAKNQVCAIFHMRYEIRKNVLPKFIKLCMHGVAMFVSLLREVQKIFAQGEIKRKKFMHAN